jgi:hypothetical protein
MAEYTALNQAHTLAEVLDNGQRLKLEDKSCWEIYEGFVDRSAGWGAGEMINVRASKDEEYPYRLINVHKNESVDARFVLK